LLDWAAAFRFSVNVVVEVSARHRVGYKTPRYLVMHRDDLIRCRDVCKSNRQICSLWLIGGKEGRVGLAIRIGVVWWCLVDSVDSVDWIRFGFPGWVDGNGPLTRRDVRDERGV